MAWAATLAETLFALGLLVGWRLRWFALAAGLLLLSFALTMTLPTASEHGILIVLDLPLLPVLTVIYR